MLRCDAATSYSQMNTAYTEAFGRPLCITDSYRPLDAQVAAFQEKPALAAVPGTSNHGWALAVDLCGGINIAGTPQWTWMTVNAARFGFVQPDWAAPYGEKPEPWHWEYGYICNLLPSTQVRPLRPAPMARPRHTTPRPGPGVRQWPRRERTPARVCKDKP